MNNNPQADDKAYLLMPQKLFVCSNGQLIKLPEGEIKLLFLKDGLMHWSAEGSSTGGIPISTEEFKAFSNAVLGRYELAKAVIQP